MGKIETLNYKTYIKQITNLRQNLQEGKGLHQQWRLPQLQVAATGPELSGPKMQTLRDMKEFLA